LGPTFQRHHRPRVGRHPPPHVDHPRPAIPATRRFGCSRRPRRFLDCRVAARAASYDARAAGRRVGAAVTDFCGPSQGRGEVVGSVCSPT
jgi:hypothetical protein